MWLVLAHLAGGLCVACMAWHPREVESEERQQSRGRVEGKDEAAAGGPRNNKAGPPLGGACMQMQLQAAARAGWQAGVGKPK